MKRKIEIIKTALICIIAAAALSACTSDKYPEPNFVSDYATLTFRGKAIINYNAFTQQISINEDNGEYSLFDDACAEYFDLDLNGFPYEEGQNIKGSISWKAAGSEKEYDKITFRVVSIDESGVIKLWDSKNGIGVVMNTRP